MMKRVDVRTASCVLDSDIEYRSRARLLGGKRNFRRRNRAVPLIRARNERRVIKPRGEIKGGKEEVTARHPAIPMTTPARL